MDAKLKERLAKIYELVKRGTPGEQQAAKLALDRFINKYNLTDIEFDKLALEQYSFKYSSQLDLNLMSILCYALLDNEKVLDNAYRTVIGGKNIVLQLTYIDYVTLSCAYEYFKRHMRGQWNKICLPKLKRIRKSSNLKKRRKELEDIFFEQYVIASKLIKPEHMKKVSMDELSDQEYKDLHTMQNVEGGEYKRQVSTGHLIEQPNYQ